MLFLLLSCTTSLSQCESYTDQARQYCIYQNAPELTDAAECDRAGNWASDCRHFWVEQRLWTTDISRATLLDACEQNEDCRLDVLDVRYSSNILNQLQNCEQFAGQNQRHCASHAMQRWRFQQRNANDFFPLLSLRNPFAEEIGYWLAITQECDQIGTCLGSGDAYRICVDYATTIRQGEMSCPALRMHPTKPIEYH